MPPDLASLRFILILSTFLHGFTEEEWERAKVQRQRKGSKPSIYTRKRQLLKLEQCAWHNSVSSETDISENDKIHGPVLEKRLKES